VTTVLSPHHMGEALVAELLHRLGTSIEDLRAVDPHSGTKQPIKRLVSSFAGASPVAVRANAPLDALSSSVCFDGMHDIDCAIEFDTSVVALELKLGATRLRLEEFRERFADKAPRLTHGGRRISGSMVAILDHNGDDVAKTKLTLRSGGKPIQQQWGLVVARQTMNTWSDNVRASVSFALGVQHLCAIIALEDIAEAVGVDTAKRVAVELVTASVDRWFT
jgi:hypothetical protein